MVAINGASLKKIAYALGYPKVKGFARNKTHTYESRLLSFLVSLLLFGARIM